MLHITKGQSNTMIVTVTEKTTIASPVYLFVFKHSATGVEQEMILADESLHTSRYNQFTFVEGGAKVLNVGEHYYTIYAQTSAVNTDPNLADEEVERGIARISATENTFNSHTISTEYKQNVL
jgi:hypothetical protein